MPTFFFDIHDGTGPVADVEGSTLANIGAAQLEATETLTQMARELFPGNDEKQISIDVRDEDGNALLTVALRLSVVHV